MQIWRRCHQKVPGTFRMKAEFLTRSEFSHHHWKLFLRSYAALTELEGTIEILFLKHFQHVLWWAPYLIQSVILTFLAGTLWCAALTWMLSFNHIMMSIWPLLGGGEGITLDGCPTRRPDMFFVASFTDLDFLSRSLKAFPLWGLLFQTVSYFFPKMWLALFGTSLL